MAPVVPRLAATVLLLRDGAEGAEVYLLRRHTTLAFAAGKYVFPGGAAETEDGDDLAVTAVRETREETGVELDPAALLPWSRWITPASLPKRFDTRFFVGRLPDGQTPGPDPEGRYGGGEADLDLWVTPAGALRRHEEKSMELMFPTLATLTELSRLTDVESVLQHARDFDWETREFRP